MKKKKKAASQLTFKTGDRELFCSRIDPHDKQTELHVKTNKGEWRRVAEFDNNECSKLFFALIQEHLIDGKKKKAEFFPDFADFGSMFGDTPEVKAARDKAEIARHRAEEMRHQAEADRHAAKDGATKVKKTKDAVESSGFSCGTVVFLMVVLPPLFVFLMALAIRAGVTGAP